MDVQTEGPDIVRTMLVQDGDTVDVTSSIIVTLLLVVIFIISSIMNTLFLVIFFRKSSFRTNSNRLIANLTIVNLVASWVLLPVVVVDTLFQTRELSFLCTPIDDLAEFTTSASIFATVMIAVDRYCAVNQPLHYPMQMNRYKSGAMIAITWVLAMIIAVIATFNPHASRPWKACQGHTSTSVPKIGSWTYQSCYTIANLFVSFVFPLAAILWIYTRIFKEAEKNSERARRSSLTGVIPDIYSQRDPSDMANSNPSSPLHTGPVQTVNMIRHRISNASLFLYKEEFRAAKISVAVFVMFIVCWFPYYFTAFLQCDLLQVAIPYDLHSMVIVMSLSNCVTSPYMYLYRSHRIKCEIHRVLGLPLMSSGETKRNLHSTNPLQLEMIPQSPVVQDENVHSNGNVDPNEGFLFPIPEPTPVSPVTTFKNKIISMKEFIWNNWGEIINVSLNMSTPVAGSTSQNAETSTFSREYTLVPS